MEAQRAGAERMATKEKSHETKKPFRKKSLKSVGNFMQRILRTLSSLSHLGQDGERGPRDAEDDDGGFKQKGSAHEDFRLVQGGDSNNNLGKNQVASRGPDRLSWNSEEKVPGVQGLKNHGNTCFMNAVVQCLSNTDLLAEFLGMEQYREDLDRAKINGVVMAKGQTNDTPMSDRGEVTERLACLVRGLWTFQYTPQLSVEFKNVVSQYGAQFRGNSQHDALEFLLWLLDRVHEDLNAAPGLALKSPSKPPPNIDPSATNLSTSPQTIKEHSFVQEHFQAQYRSSLTCPHCHKQSDTFDPFLCVSLPIPLRQTRAMNITLVFQSNQKRFLRVGLAVPLLGTVAALRQMVADEGKMPPDQVVLAELYPTGFQRSFSNEDDLNSIAEGDPVYAFQAPLPLPKAGVTTRTSGYPQSLPASPRCSEAEGQRLPGSSSLSSEHLASSSKILLLLCNLDGSGQQAERFGPPLLVREERTLSWEQLQQCIVGKIRYLMKSDAHPQNGATFFHIRVAGGPVTGSYLSPKDPRPLQHPAVDRALQTSGTGGPPHVKLSVEWEPKTKERLFGSIREEVVQDAESVRSQQIDHQQQSCTLNECFHLYTKEEQLAPDDAWRCPYCKVLQQGTVKLSLWTLPDILIIHLKRFRQVGGRRNKLSTLVRFPLSGLDMAPHVVKRGQPSKGMLGQWSSWKQSPCPAESGHLDVLYDLYAVCNHHGSLQGGHYTAYCRNSLDARWYNYDDSSVELVPEDEVCTRGAYILFYQKRNAIPAWSASSSVRGSTSSSMSDHWALRLSGSKRESLVSRATSNCTPLPRLPDSPVFLDKETHPDKGCIGSKSFSRGVKGRSASMKVSSVSKLKLNISKAVPLRWSFGSKDRSKPVTGELVEYLESGRRPKFTNDSIVPLMAEKSQPKSINPKAQGANVTGRSSDHSQGEATVSTAGGQAKQSGSFSKTETPRSNPKDNKNLPDSTSRGGQRKVEGTTQPKHRPSFESPSGICSSPADGFLKDKPSSSKKPDHNQRSHHKDVDNTRTRPSEAEGQHDAKLTKSRSSFAKKEAKKQSGSESFNITELPNGAPRTTLSNGVLGDGRTSGTMPHRHKEDLTNGKSQVDIRRAQSSSNVQNKAEWTMKRSASLYKNGSVSQQPPRQMSAERVSSGTLQRLKYQTSSLGRKKTVPESSF